MEKMSFSGKTGANIPFHLFLALGWQKGRAPVSGGPRF